MLCGMDYIIDRYQELDDAVHEAREAVSAHFRKVWASARADDPVPQPAEAIDKAWVAEFDRLRKIEDEGNRGA